MTRLSCAAAVCAAWVLLRPSAAFLSGIHRLTHCRTARTHSLQERSSASVKDIWMKCPIFLNFAHNAQSEPNIMQPRTDADINANEFSTKPRTMSSILIDSDTSAGRSFSVSLEPLMPYHVVYQCKKERRSIAVRTLTFQYRANKQSLKRVGYWIHQKTRLISYYLYHSYM